MSEIMSKELLVARPGALLDECLRLMENHGVFHLLKVEEESGKFLGMISVADLLQVIASITRNARICSRRSYSHSDSGKAPRRIYPASE